MPEAATQDFFTKARRVAGTALFLAGTAAVVGAFLEWVTFTLDAPTRFEGTVREAPSSPISGLDVGHDGTVVLVAGVVIVACAFLLVLRGRGRYAGLALVAAIVVGAVAVSDYKGVADLAPNVRVGQPGVGIGLVLVAAAGVAGVIASVAGIVASPRRPDA